MTPGSQDQQFRQACADLGPWCVEARSGIHHRSAFTSPTQLQFAIALPIQRIGRRSDNPIDPVTRRSMKLGDARPIAGAGRCPLGAAARTERLEGRDGRDTATGSSGIYC